nr:uncharacterized protein LOC113808365 [Penaeus vannamei]
MTDNNTVITVQVGATAAMRCQVFDVADHETVSWIRRRDHHLITVGANTYSNDERFQVTFSEKLQMLHSKSVPCKEPCNHHAPSQKLSPSKDWTLHVHYAQPRDAGMYECQLSAHPPMGVFTTLNVIVLRKLGSPCAFNALQVISSCLLIEECNQISEYTITPKFYIRAAPSALINNYPLHGNAT